MLKPVIAFCVVASLAACEMPQQVQQNTFSSPESTVATQILQEDPTGTLLPSQPQTSVGQVIAQEAIKTLGAAVRGGIALAIDQKFNQNSNQPLNPYSYQLE